MEERESERDLCVPTSRFVYTVHVATRYRQPEQKAVSSKMGLKGEKLRMLF